MNAIGIALAAFAVGVFTATLGYLTWRANVYAREWREARDRIRMWISSYGVSLESLYRSPRSRIEGLESPPFSYDQRLYCYRQLEDDLVYVTNTSTHGAWGPGYVGESVLAAVAEVALRLNRMWFIVHRIPEFGCWERELPAILSDADCRREIVHGLQRLNMLDEQVRNQHLRGWLRNLAARRRKINRLGYRAEQQSLEAGIERSKVMRAHIPE